MRICRPRQPAAELLGAAPRRNGRWLSVWITVDGVLSVTIGMTPGDAATARRGSRHATREDARAAADQRLSDEWETYCADRPVRSQWSPALLRPLSAGDTPHESPSGRDEQPVPASVAVAAVRGCIVRPRPAL
jgi:hypothetical protein